MGTTSTLSLASTSSMSSGMASSVIPFEVGGLYKSIECPVSGIALLDAVSIGPCKHRVCLAVAIKKFGELNKEACERPGPCPVCGRTVTTYSADEILGGMVRLLLALRRSPERLMTSVVADRRLEVEQKAMAYPGLYGEFVCSGNWKKCHLDRVPARSLHFRNRLVGSLIESFEVHGYSDNSIAIIVKTNNAYVMVKYFASIKIESKYVDLKTYRVCSRDSIIRFVDIIHTNNTMPTQPFELLKLIVITGRANCYDK